VNSPQGTLAERREALVAQSDRERAQLGAIFGGLERKFTVADAMVVGARRLTRHRALIGAAGVCLIFAPVAARSWIRRAAWMVPLALDGYRTVKSMLRRRDEAA